jgi:MoaA/NifB/PqqE/SkfB family radical SAM enzyme
MKIAGELWAGREVLALFRAESSLLEAVSVIFATYRRQNAGELAISLYRVQPSNTPAPPPGQVRPWKRRWARLRAKLHLSQPPVAVDEPLAGNIPVVLGERLASMTMPCAALLDNQPLDFFIGKVATTKGELLALRLRTNAPAGAAPTVWITDGMERIGSHSLTYAGDELHEGAGLRAGVTYGGMIASIEVPKMLLYSPISQCNLNCIHCISRFSRSSLNKLPEHVRDWMREWAAAGKLETISSDYSGDILWADQRFGGELDFINELDIPFHVDTNGVCLTEDVSERLCKMKIASLNISLDAAEEETYKRVRKGSLPLHEIVTNIETMMRIRAAAKCSFPVSLSFTLMRSNLDEWCDFLRLGARLGVDIVIARHLEAYTEDMESDSLWHDQAAYNAARIDAMALSESLGILATFPEPFQGIALPGRRPCTVPWESAVILGNGDVAACCVPGLTMGNLNEATMEEIWNGPRYQELRATVNSDKPLPVCAACPMFRKTDNPDSYLIHSALERMNA